MTLDFLSGLDFAQVLADAGESVTQSTRTAAVGADALGERPPVTSGSNALTAVVQEASVKELKQFPGILEIGDKILYLAAGAPVIAALDLVTIRGVVHRVITSWVFERANTVLYRKYACRRVGGH